MMFLSEPVQNRVTSNWTVFLARKVTGRDGRFLGLIVVDLGLAYFERLYEEVGFGGDSAVSLFRQDGVLLARHPRVEATIGQSFAVGAYFRQLLAAGSQADLGRRVSTVDGQERLIATQFLPHYPLAVAVSLGVDHALEEWRKQAVYLVAAALLLELVIGGISLLMVRQQRGQQLLVAATAARGQAEAELAIARERERAQEQAHIQDARFGLALRTMTQGVSMFDGENRLVAVNPRYEAMFGMPEGSAVLGMRFDDVACPGRGRRAVHPGGGSRGKAADAGPHRLRRARVLHQRTGGRPQPGCHRRHQPMAGGGWVATYEDITERRQRRGAHRAHGAATTR